MTRFSRIPLPNQRMIIASFQAFAVWLGAAVVTIHIFPTLGPSLPISPIWAANALAYGVVMARGLYYIPAFVLAALVWNLWRGDPPLSIAIGTLAFTLMLVVAAGVNYAVARYVEHDRDRRFLTVPLVALSSASLFALLGAWQFSDGWPSQALLMTLWLSGGISVLVFSPLAIQVCRYGFKSALPTKSFADWPLWWWLGMGSLVLVMVWQLGEGTTLWHRGVPLLAVLVPVLAVYWLPSLEARGLVALFVLGWIMVNVSIVVQPGSSLDALAWLSRQWVVFVASLIGFLAIEAVRSLEAANHRLAEMRLLDGVTGLANELAISQLARQLKAGQVSVIGVQVPHADELAALVGEATVHNIECHISAQLHVQSGHALCVARLRPGLFALVLKGDDRIQNATVAEHLAHTLTNNNNCFEVASVSLGIKVVTLACVDVLALRSIAAILLTACRHANVEPQGALYHYQGVASELIAQQSQEAAWIHSLRAALSGDNSQGSLVLYAQPIVAFRHPDQFRCEILLRWRNPDGRLVSPQQFLPIAEAFGLMPQIDRWVIQQTLTALTQHPEGRRLNCVSINLSGSSLACSWLVGLVESLLAAHHWPASGLCLELTESDLVHDVSAATRNIQALHALDVRFAIDDFGTGRATFAYLKDYPAEELKIDGSFIHQLESSAFDREVVRSTCALADQLNAHVVAEFVETDAQIMLLDEMGARFLQGYGLGQPQPLGDYLSMLDTLAETWQARFSKLSMRSSV